VQKLDPLWCDRDALRSNWLPFPLRRRASAAALVLVLAARSRNESWFSCGFKFGYAR